MAKVSYDFHYMLRTMRPPTRSRRKSVGPGVYRSGMPVQNWHFDDWSPDFRKNLRQRGHISQGGYVDNHVPGPAIKGEFLERNRRREIPPPLFYGLGSKYYGRGRYRGRGLYGAMPTSGRQRFLPEPALSLNKGYLRRGRGTEKGLYRGYSPDTGFFYPRGVVAGDPFSSP